MIARVHACILICTLAFWNCHAIRARSRCGSISGGALCCRAIQPLPDVAAKLFPTIPPSNLPPTSSSDLDEDWPDPNSSKRTKVKTTLRSPSPQMKMEAGLIKNDDKGKTLGFQLEYNFTPVHQPVRPIWNGRCRQIPSGSKKISASRWNFRKCR